MTVQFSEPHVQKLKEYFESFREFLSSDKAKKWGQERKNRIELYAKLLNKKAIDKLTEVELGQILRGLWANAGWTNKAYPADRVLKSNDVSLLKSELKNLLWGDQTLEQRYERFRNTVKGLGPAGRTEIMAFVNPKECGLWNERAREAIRKLGLDNILPANKYSISGDEYVQFNEAIKSIGDLMKENGLPYSDLIDVDFYLYFIATTTPTITKEEGEDYDFDHDEIIEKLVEIGNGLGFEVKSGELVAKGAKVDAVWTAKIANLGVVNYVFEVQRKGSVDSSILNLQKAKYNPTVQKLVVVANGRVIKEIKEEVASLGEEFRKLLTFIEAKDILKSAKLLEEFNNIISKLELIQQ